MQILSKIEKKIQKLFHKACADYGLLTDGDKVLVALSGGKDSLELLRLLAFQQKIYKPRIHVSAVHVVMDNVPYETDLSYITDFCEKLDVKLHVVHTSFEERKDSNKPTCFMCSWNRRKTIFNFATQEGYNKVALGHHQDDVLVTLLMNMFYEGSIQTMPPSLQMKHYPITIIRPMCLVPEYMIEQVAGDLAFEKQKARCPFEKETRRNTVTEMFRRMEQENSEVRHSLWSSMSNIYQSMLPHKSQS